MRSHYIRIKGLRKNFHTAQKMKFSGKDLFSICDQIRSYLHIWSYLLKKSLMENFIFCAVIGLRKSFQNSGDQNID